MLIKQIILTEIWEYAELVEILCIGSFCGLLKYHIQANILQLIPLQSLIVLQNTSVKNLMERTLEFLYYIKVLHTVHLWHLKRHYSAKDNTQNFSSYCNLESYDNQELLFKAEVDDDDDLGDDGDDGYNPSEMKLKAAKLAQSVNEVADDKDTEEVLNEFSFLSNTNSNEGDSVKTADDGGGELKGYWSTRPSHNHGFHACRPSVRPSSKQCNFEVRIVIATGGTVAWPMGSLMTLILLKVKLDKACEFKVTHQARSLDCLLNGQPDGLKLMTIHSAWWVYNFAKAYLAPLGNLKSLKKFYVYGV